jgi:soluble lytic murein transglycosylase-like protein
MNYLLGIGIAILIFSAWWSPCADAVPSENAKKYQRALTGNARVVWGLSAPVATFAAQVHQESGWREDARSPFAGGLAQFTPDTAKWISRQYNDELGTGDPFNPAWALRALVRYDRYLWDRVLPAATECDRMAFALAAYNGGLGWVHRDRAKAVADGADASRWWLPHVEYYNTGRAPEFFKENRGYPRRILLRLQKEYEAWGPSVDCKEVSR